MALGLAENVEAMSRITLHAIALVLALVAMGTAAAADGLTALARVDGPARVTDTGQGALLSLPLSRGVPWRMFTLADPWRLVIDFSEVDWTGFDADAFDLSSRVTAVRTGAFAPGWSRMVLQLDRPLKVAGAGLQTGTAGGAMLSVALEGTTETDFRAHAGAPEAARYHLPAGTVQKTATKHRQTGEAPLLVVLDPGHGGIDPGAQSGGTDEKDITLMFARELREMLLRAGMDVILTRTDDSFVPLEARLSIAHAAGADLFISLHADSIAEGRASGATVYTLAHAASDDASRKLAERHDRDDLLAGVDLSAQDDVVAGVLMDLGAHRDRAAVRPAGRRAGQGAGGHRRRAQAAAACRRFLGAEGRRHPVGPDRDRLPVLGQGSGQPAGPRLARPGRDRDPRCVAGLGRRRCRRSPAGAAVAAGRSPHREGRLPLHRRLGFAPGGRAV